MRFVHFSDVHIGSWRDIKLREISTLVFCKAMDMCIEKNVDFILISGDLFNTSLPTIDRLKIVVEKLKEVKKKGIAVYVIAGSHDFSPSGKTMLDVLESAELFINVVKGEVQENKLFLQFTVDPKTNAKITGMLGKKGMLDRLYYEALSLDHLEQEDGFKIFMFHTAITEFKPIELELMESTPLSFFPKNFHYYAGGHVHYIYQEQVKEYGLFTYPGALFPNNFRELEKYHHGGFYLYEDGKVEYCPVKLYPVVSFYFDCENKTAQEVNQEMLFQIGQKEVKDAIITLRFEGMLAEGKATDIDIKTIITLLYEKNAYFVMKNMNKLTSRQFEQILISIEKNADIEESFIQEHLKTLETPLLALEKREIFIKELFELCNAEKQEGERIVDFEERIKKDFIATVKKNEILL